LQLDEISSHLDAAGRERMASNVLAESVAFQSSAWMTLAKGTHTASDPSSAGSAMKATFMLALKPSFSVSDLPE
jgi:hypothetical protein